MCLFYRMSGKEGIHQKGGFFIAEIAVHILKSTIHVSFIGKNDVL